jgi:hypothetical protein
MILPRLEDVKWNMCSHNQVSFSSRVGLFSFWGRSRQLDNYQADVLGRHHTIYSLNHLVNPGAREAEVIGSV